MSTFLTQSVSISESFHASQTARDQDQWKVKNGLESSAQDADSKRGEEESPRKDEMSVCVQCLLSMVFAGIELSTSFTMIYGILFMQFLGVPTSLVSLSGVICGTSAFILLPIIGRFSDSGSNPVKRKICMMLIGYSTYALGYIGLAFCSIWKLYPTHRFQINSTSGQDYTGFIESIVNPEHQSSNVETFQGYTTSQTNLSFNTTVPFGSIAGTSYINLETIDSKNNQTSERVYDDGVTFISFIGIISFALLDMAFDASMSLCRAFVLECSPPAVHSRLLFSATLFGASASCLFGFIGTFDIPGYLGPLLQLDGTPATILVFSCAIVFIQTCCYICTTTMGYVLAKEKNLQFGDQNRKNNINLENNNFKKSLSKHSQIRISTESLHHNANPSEALLPPAHKLGKNHYNSCESRPQEREGPFGVNTVMPSHKPKEDESNILCENKILHITFQQETNDKINDSDDDDDDDDDDVKSDNCDDDRSLLSSTGSEDERDNEKVFDGNEDEGQSKNIGIPSLFATLPASYSISMSVSQSIMLSQANQDSLANNKSSITKYETQPIWKNKRLMVLCVSVFFGMACLLSFSQFSGFTLTIGIYHGEPLAVLGSPGRQLYEKGLRQTALSFLVCFILYSSSSALLNKITHFIGENAMYILCQIIMVSAYVTLIVLKTEAVFFVASAVAGIYRSCPFSLGYILANKYAQEDSSMMTGNSKKPATNLGQVMVMIGMMLPCAYLIASIAMGPLMSVTNNAFVPMIYGSVNGSLSLLTFCVLLVMKR